MLTILRALLLIGQFALAAVLLWFALDWRSPFFASVRMMALAALLALPVALIALNAWSLRRAKALLTRSASFTTLLIALTAFGVTLFAESRFQWQRYKVLHADQARLERLGTHLIVGYRSGRELRELIERRAIAGVFIGGQNVRGRDANAIRSEIAGWQATRKQQGLPPLWIATDQEGGAVSRMSPPLPRLPSLGEIVRQYPVETERQAAVRRYAQTQGRGLADLGVNLNFAPVVDLDHGVVNPNDRYTRIGERAIAADPTVVTVVAGEYCATLSETGVRCTLKHFPGLGRVFEDTHFDTADLRTSVAELARTDWVPFRALMNSGAFTMIGHARLTAIDGQRPSSASEPVTGGLLRGDWKHDGVLVSDDFSMGAVYYSPDGIAGASVAAINAGIDLILISYDPDQYFPVMHDLLAAEADRRLKPEMLDRSGRRLARAAATQRQDQ